MFEKLKALEDKFNEINERLMQPEVVNDSKLYTELMIEYRDLQPIVEKLKEYDKAKAEFDEAVELINDGGLDKDMKEMVQEQYDESKTAINILFMASTPLYHDILAVSLLFLKNGVKKQPAF